MFDSSNPEPQQSGPFDVLRKILPFLSVTILIATVYVGWTFYSRWSDEKDAVRAESDKEAAAAQKTLDLLGGGGFKILAFYAYPGAIHRGMNSEICFGVSGAKLVKIEPGVEPVKPALNQCLSVSPKKSTEYTLTADDGKGHTAKQSFVLEVR